MLSSELHDQKPYAFPAQCVPYAGIKEQDIHSLLSKLIEEMVAHGMEVADNNNNSVK